MLSSRVGIADRSSWQRLRYGSASPLESQSLDLSTKSTGVPDDPAVRGLEELVRDSCGFVTSRCSSGCIPFG